jgi:DNA invertase Pin-like site-specific DNA recombinase
MRPRAALYLRQSVDSTGLGAAIDRQRQDCRALAEARGWTVVAEHVDNDVSATARRRPAFEAMMTAAGSGEFDVIVAWHVDRLVRRLADLEPVMATCQALRIQIATVTGELDPSTDTGRLVARILSSVAQAEVERKAARQARANRQRAEQGHVRLVRRPFGYDLAGRIQRREANALRWAADRILDGATFAQVSRELNARDVPTSTGREWRASSLTKVLRNPRYAGLATYHGQPIAPGQWTAILTLEQHQALVARVQALVPQVNPGPAHRHLLSGIATCGLCGTLLGVNMDGRTGRRTYRCPKLHLSRQLDAVDDTVVTAALGHLLDLARTPSDPPSGRSPTTAERRELVAAEMAMRDATRRWIHGDLDDASWTQAARPMRLALASATRRIAPDQALQITAALRAARRAHPSRSLRAHWDRLTPTERRTLVATLTTDICVRPAGRGHRFEPSQVAMHWRDLTPRSPPQDDTRSLHRGCFPQTSADP